MAKHQKAKSASTGRNSDRPNGKAWSRHHRGANDMIGHNSTGRTKPSGNTVGGHSVRKIRTAEHDLIINNPKLKTTLTEHGITLSRVSKIRESRNAAARRARRKANKDQKSSTLNTARRAPRVSTVNAQ